MLTGVLLVIVCVGGALWWSRSAQERIAVLVIARSVGVGHVLERADLREVEISAADPVATVPAEQGASVLGRPMATSLVPGALLTPGSVGPSAIPAPGQAVVAVRLKAGQFPNELAPGSHVLAVSAADQGSAWFATVVGLAGAETGQVTVASLQTPGTTALALARIPADQVVLVLLAGGER